MMFPGGARMLVDGGGMLQFGKEPENPTWTSARTWSRRICGAGESRPWMLSSPPTLMRITSGDCRRSSKTSGRRSFGWGRILRMLWLDARRARRPGASTRRGRAVRFLRRTRRNCPLAAWDYRADKLGNNDSLAFRVSFGSRTFLLTAIWRSRWRAGCSEKAWSDMPTC